MTDYTDEEIELISTRLSNEGWRSPYMARVLDHVKNEQTPEEKLAGWKTLREADLEAEAQNKASLIRALTGVVLDPVVPEDEFPKGEKLCSCTDPRPSSGIESGKVPYPMDAWLRCVQCRGVFR